MDNTLKIYKPFHYLNVVQTWNNPNPIYGQFGFTHHNGLDLTCGYANQKEVYAPKKWPVYCPVEGFTVQLVRYMPNGGGNEMWLVSDQKVQIGDKLCNAYLVMAHADKILVPVGYKPKLGELLMIADNTGFSTGPHTHLGLYRTNYDGIRFTYLDQNDANGSYNPQEFFTEEFAVDKADLPTLIKSNMRYYQYKIGL